LFLFIARAAGYIYRIRYITNKVLSWKSSFYVIILWEFGSAVTPTVVGGTAVAVYILLKEGLSLGKSLAYAIFTAILDNFVFLAVLPLIIFFTEGNLFRGLDQINIYLGLAIEVGFYLSYSLIALYTLFMTWGLFISPRAFKWLLIRATYIRFLRKWRSYADEQGNEIILASKQLKRNDPLYWLRAFASTIFIWIMRFLMINFLIAAFFEINIAEHITIFSRQLILWIVMLISPTPGASGIAEGIFLTFFGEFSEIIIKALTILWRILTFLPYLLLGAIFIPPWIRRVYFIKRKSR